MSRIRGKDTKPELLVRRLVHRMGYRFRLHRPDLPGKPDLVFAGRRKVIFVHGCFWHRHSECSKGRSFPSSSQEFWRSKLDGNVTRDRLSVRALEELGWRALVIWECQTTPSELDLLVGRISSFLDS